MLESKLKPNTPDSKRMLRRWNVLWRSCILALSGSVRAGARAIAKHEARGSFCPENESRRSSTREPLFSRSERWLEKGCTMELLPPEA